MTRILIAGFGGQGILFTGKQLATAGMNIGKNVSWLPSYGPEMRGGTSNCSVCISDVEIGSPLVGSPDILLVFNLPSYEKFEPKVEKGGIMIVDSSMVEKMSTRDDITSIYIPARNIAEENNMSGLANVIMLGRLLREKPIFEFGYFEQFIRESGAKKKPELGELNAAALKIGYEYTA